MIKIINQQLNILGTKIANQLTLTLSKWMIKTILLLMNKVTINLVDINKDNLLNIMINWITKKEGQIITITIPIWNLGQFAPHSLYRIIIWRKNRLCNLKAFWSGLIAVARSSEWMIIIHKLAIGLHLNKEKMKMNISLLKKIWGRNRFRLCNLMKEEII